MKQLDLFAGINGFGSEDTLLSCEKDIHCQAVLRYHQPDIPIIEDVRDVTKATVSFQPDIITAGVPCQDVSVAGKREGLDGERTGLFFEFVRIVQEFQPAWIAFENVPGILSSNEKRDFARVIGELGQCGYFLAYRILDSQYWGVAQRRRRVFIVGSLGNTGCVQVLFESEGLPWNPQKGRPPRQEAAGSLGSHATGGWGNDLDNQGAFVVGTLAANCGPKSHDAGNFHCNQGVDAGHVVAVTETGHGFWNEGKPRLRAKPGGGPQTLICLNDQGGSQMAVTENQTATLRHEEHGHQPLIAFHSRQDPITDDSVSLPLESSTPQGVAVCYDGLNQKINENIAPSIRIGKDSGDFVCFPIDTRNALRDPDKKDKMNRQGCGVGKDGDPSPTITDAFTPAIGSNQFGVRRLTPLECERLQGFEDGWTKYGRKPDGTIYEISDTQRYRMLGNAITKTVGGWIHSRIKK